MLRARWGIVCTKKGVCPGRRLAGCTGSVHRPPLTSDTRLVVRPIGAFF